MHIDFRQLAKINFNRYLNIAKSTNYEREQNIHDTVGIQALKNRLNNFYNKFSADSNNTYSQFPINKFKQPDVEKFIVELFFASNKPPKEIDCGRHTVDDLSQKSTNDDIEFLHNPKSTVVIIDILKKIVADNCIDDTISKIFNSIDVDIADFVEIDEYIDFVFQNERKIHAELIKHKEYINGLKNNPSKKDDGSFWVYNLLWKIIESIIKNPQKDLLEYKKCGISIDILPKYRKMKMEINDITHPVYVFEQSISLINIFYDLSSKIYNNIKSYKEQHQHEYIYYGYLRDYYRAVLNFIGTFLNYPILNNFAIQDKQKKKILKDFFKEIKSSEALKFNYDEIRNETNIWDAYNLYIIYYQDLLIYKEEMDDIQPTLQDRQYDVSIKKRYKITKGSTEDSVNYWRDKLSEQYSKNHIEKKIVKKLEDIILEGDYDQRFSEKLFKTKKIMKLFNKYDELSISEDSICDLKVFYRELYVDKTQLKKLNQAMTIIENYIYENDFYIEQDKYANFKTSREYRFLLLKIGRGFARESERLKEIATVNKIQKCVAEILLKIFFSFDYDTILSDLHLVTKILCDILKNILKTEWDEILKADNN